MLPKKVSSRIKGTPGLKKVWISGVSPEIDNGEFPVKRIINSLFTVEADIFSDSMDFVQAVCLYKHQLERTWHTAHFTSLDNDRMQAQFLLKKLGVYTYKIQAWVNDFETWRQRFIKKLQLKNGYQLEALIGVQILETYLNKDSAIFLNEIINKLKNITQPELLLKLISGKKIIAWGKKNYKPYFISEYHELAITVDRRKAQFSTWYEIFPRSVGNFANLIKELTLIKMMGFDVVYFPPIHPIGMKNRKGKNNTLLATLKDPGSPWAIGGIEGGHTDIHPALGKFSDFKKIIKHCNELGIEIALDFALQCSPDHPYIHAHPTWFNQRPDGSLQYAENPPKKYQDIYPFNFASENWQEMWLEFKSILLFWIKEGVKIFRVDNPHTKPFIFWQWLIHSIKNVHPEVLFLSEAFTRPKPMYLLAKCGFTQSYTYFTWRNNKAELINYMLELNAKPQVDFFRPNFWPNTPDILPEILQKGGKIAFMIRVTLAATLASNYGIYGPAFENCINQALEEGSEEYLDSEKYELKQWQDSPENIRSYITKLNQIRQENVALQNTHLLYFLPSDNPEIISFYKLSEYSEQNIIIVVINLDFKYKQSAFIDIDLSAYLKNSRFFIKDLLTDEYYAWENGKCYVALNPLLEQCAHIFKIEVDNE